MLTASDSMGNPHVRVFSALRMLQDYGKLFHPFHTACGLSKPRLFSSTFQIFNPKTMLWPTLAIISIVHVYLDYISWLFYTLAPSSKCTTCLGSAGPLLRSHDPNLILYT